MILYLDTSSLVKLYIEETDSGKVTELVESSKVTCTSLIAYAETRAAFARRFREKAFDPKNYHRLVEAFEKDWKNYFIVMVSKELVQLAGDLAERRELRGFDAIHLSSAIILHQETGVPIFFSCFDSKLQTAAEKENLLHP